MKPPEELTDEELRIEIAEWCGWTYCIMTCVDWGKPELRGYPPGVETTRESRTAVIGGTIGTIVPNYPNDLNAMWDAEEELLMTKDYIINWINYEETVNDFHATAKQRAIDFVKTIRELKDKK
jgi:hypothetical protein